LTGSCHFWLPAILGRINIVVVDVVVLRNIHFNCTMYCDENVECNGNSGGSFEVKDFTYVRILNVHQDVTEILV